MSEKIGKSKASGHGTIVVPREFHEEIKKLAEKKGMWMKSYLKEAVEYYEKHNKKGK